MALHGELKVNGYIIGDWSAVRKERLYTDPIERDVGPKFRYACEMTLNGETMCGDVYHYFDDGAVVLLQKICKMYEDKPC